LGISKLHISELDFSNHEISNAPTSCEGALMTSSITNFLSLIFPPGLAKLLLPELAKLLPPSGSSLGVGWKEEVSTRGMGGLEVCVQLKLTFGQVEAKN
jgi:hypothetical protein